MKDLPRLDHLPDVLKRRARHVITENDRVLKAVLAMKEGRSQDLGKLFFESHLSMRDDYQVSVPEIDTLVELAKEQKEIVGARLTGGGFGGSVVMISKKGSGAEVSKKISEQYQNKTKRVPTVLVP
jgi:galactokinase